MVSLSGGCQELRISCTLSWSCPGLSQPVFNGFVMNANTDPPFTLQWSRPARVRVTFPAGTLSRTPRLGKGQGGRGEHGCRGGDLEISWFCWDFPSPGHWGWTWS